MSWFDATGFASLAKTALKEAQKTIDKALDIKEDDDGCDASDNSKSKSTTTSTISVNEEHSSDSMKNQNNSIIMKQSISNPILSSVATATSASNLWGSFTGSFFDATAQNDGKMPAVTRAPTSTSETRFAAKESTNSTISGRTSSASESVEILSSPMTPLSNPTSPSASKIFILYKHISISISGKIHNFFCSYF